MLTNETKIVASDIKKGDTVRQLGKPHLPGTVTNVIVQNKDRIDVHLNLYTIGMSCVDQYHPEDGLFIYDRSN